MLQQIFDRIYIINLASRRDRRQRVEGELKRIGAEVDGDRIRFFDAIRPEDAAGFPNIGAHGCFRSHLEVLKLARRESENAFLILEDDVCFPADFSALATPVLAAAAQQQWDVFYGGYRNIQSASPITTLVASDNTVETTHCIGFKTALAADLIDYLEAMRSRPPGSPEGGPMHVDGAYSWFRRARPDVLTLAASPAIAHQTASRSDITQRSALDRLPVIRDVVEAARELRRRITG